MEWVKIKLIFLVLSTLISRMGYSQQMALIKDSDGFTNVRQEPQRDSKIVYRIKENQVFFYYSEGNEDWVYVEVNKNNYSLSKTSGAMISGYIHKSRLLPLAGLPIYKGTNISCKYEISPFDSSNKYIEKLEGEWIETINGREFWGTDGGVPKIEVTSLLVSINGNQFQISPALLEDIYECSNEFTIYVKHGFFYFYQMNSDGAGGYELVWAFTKDGLQQRLVGSIL